MKLQYRLITALISFIICCSLIPLDIYSADIIETPKFDDINDYNDFLKNLSDKPINFVSLAMLDGLGKFNFFYADSFTKPQYYSYSFVDENDFMFGITIFHNKSSLNFEDFPFVEAPLNTENMLYLDTNKSKCSISKNGVIYSYSKGRLINITWFIENVAFMVSPANQEYGLSNYPLNQKTTFLSRILSGDPLIATYAISKLRIQILWGWIQPFAIALVLVIAFSVFVAFLIKKSRRAISARPQHFDATSETISISAELRSEETSNPNYGNTE